MVELVCRAGIPSRSIGVDSNEVVRDIVSKHGRIDVLKIDIGNARTCDRWALYARA